jgi:hypothetical protein
MEKSVMSEDRGGTYPLGLAESPRPASEQASRWKIDQNQPPECKKSLKTFQPFGNAPAAAWGKIGSNAGRSRNAKRRNKEITNGY